MIHFSVNYVHNDGDEGIRRRTWQQSIDGEGTLFHATERVIITEILMINNGRIERFPTRIALGAGETIGLAGLVTPREDRPTDVARRVLERLNAGRE